MSVSTKKNFGKKLFCNGIIPLTPEKPEEVPMPTSTAPSQISNVVTSSPGQTTSAPSTCGTLSPVVSAPALASQAVVTITSTLSQFAPIMSPSQSDPSSLFTSDYNMRLSDTDLVRRYSLSLRSPPLGSLASEVILASQDPNRPPPQPLVLGRTRELIKDLNEQLDQFASCQSSPSSQSGSSSDGDDEDNTTDRDEYRTMNDRKRAYRTKRKASSTPTKESFLKKSNTEF